MDRRAGFTLVELLISLAMLLVVTGAAVQFIRRQTSFVSRQSSTMDALQNAGFAASQIERELREAGAGVVDVQPLLVQADTDAITFSANLLTTDPGDPTAVYQNPDADPKAARAMLVQERRALPNSSVYYPDVTYAASGGMPSGAETISYYLRPDSTSAIADRWLLLRRVNALAPTLVARGIAKDPGIPFFSYYRVDGTNQLAVVPADSIPAFHVKLHGAVDDVAGSKITDDIRVVRMHFLSVSRDPRTGLDATRLVETRVRLLNAGLVHASSCGQPPLPVSPPMVMPSPAGAAVPSVTIAWTASGDDNGAGEHDIMRYAIFRRLATETDFGDPLASVPAGRAGYVWVDISVATGTTYVYGVAAQDCTPQLSSTSASPQVTVTP